LKTGITTHNNHTESYSIYLKAVGRVLYIVRRARLYYYVLTDS